MENDYLNNCNIYIYNNTSLLNLQTNSEINSFYEFIMAKISNFALYKLLIFRNKFVLRIYYG